MRALLFAALFDLLSKLAFAELCADKLPGFARLRVENLLFLRARGFIAR